MEKLTKKQIDAKALELSKKLDCKVTPAIIDNVDIGQVVGFFQDPSYDTIMYFMDAYQAGQTSKCADYALTDCLLESESDPRIMSNERKHSRIKASFAYAVIKFITPFTDGYNKMSEETKKKSEVVSLKEQKH
jgi:hypothetical protein